MNFKAQYKNVFRDVGLLEVLTNCLVHYSVALKNITANGGRVTPVCVRKEQFRPIELYSLDQSEMILTGPLGKTV